MFKRLNKSTIFLFKELLFSNRQKQLFRRSKSTYIIFFEEPRMFESISGGQDHVLQQLAVRERGDVIVTTEVLGQPLQGLRVDAARVDPLRFRVVGGFNVAAGGGGHFGLQFDSFEIVEGPRGLGHRRLGGGGRSRR